jgi:nucleoporin POM152
VQYQILTQHRSSAMLNPNDGSFCIGASTKMIDLPILMNQTVPIALELLRIDLETNTNETIAVSGKELKKLKTQGGKTSGKKDTSMRTLLYPIRQTGLYRLLRVVDESKLEVQRQSSDVLVVTCPSGHIKTVASDKCRGELSDFYLHIKATPPLKIKYSKRINQEDRSHVSLTVHPENLETPMAPESPSDALTRIGRDSGDYSWAQTRHVQVPVNETFGIKGSWLYAIDEIEDGVGNIIDYTREISRPHKSARDGSISQSFVVHERPRAILEGCSPQKPLKAAKGRSRNLPVRFNPTGQFTTEAKHHITYSFLPQRSDSSGVDDEQTTSLSATLSGSDPGPEISEPGLYSLTSVASDYCAGEILEPSSCLLSNPPEPELALTSESIPHQCAGNSIGLRVNLDFIGTPPFEFTYNVHHRGHGKTVAVEKVAEMRTQLEFRPRDAGQYTYEFLDIADSVYRIPRSLRHATLKLEQDVKPTAWATFAQRSPQQQACIQEPATFQVRLSGDSPWDLDYDLVHNGKRTKHKISGIEDSSYTLTTPNLNAGGQYSLSLTSITDISGCRVHLKEEAKIDVRMQRPTAAFGMLEGSRSASTLQGKPLSLPVRFSGEPPWIMSYSRTGDGDIIHKQRFQAANDILSVDIADTYNIVDVSDKFCPGSVETKARQFEVLWIPKPSVALSRIPALEKVGDTFHKKAVCEGDHDSVELSFTGNSPYYVKYDVHMKPERGSAAVSTKQDKFGLHTASLRMDTAKSGVYQYAITELGDRLYNHDRKSAPLLQIQQQVHGRPSASFLNAGRTYNYCKEDAVGDEVIPIILTGAPPFTLEIGIKHLTAASPEINTEHVKSNRYDLRIPHTALSLGLHIISIRKVTDANGCQKIMGTDAPTTRVTVVDVPSISPLETATDFCVGDRISYTLVGTPPFRVHYSFEGVQQKASVSTNSFRRIAERPGNFTITAVSDKASTESCRARTKFTKVIHALPSVRISKGQTDELDIHEGGEADLLFEFEGTPPFYFT